MLAPTLQHLSTVLKSHQTPLTLREALSGISGSLSLTAWIFLLLPQLIENYRNQSAEAVSLTFLFIWFVGDVCNLFGSLWAKLVPVVIAIGAYFCILDTVLISQTFYYGIRNRRREGKTLLEATRGTFNNNVAAVSASASAPAAASQEGASTIPANDSSETSPLIRKRSRTGSITIPGSTSTSPILISRRRSSDISSRRRRSSATHRPDDQLTKILEENDAESGARLWLRNVITLLTIVAIATAGWALAYQSGAWTPQPAEGSSDPSKSPQNEEKIDKGAQVLGYASAVLYLCARIHQIVKNWRDKSCEGLSLLFFILSLVGNLTYGTSILFHSTQRAYVIKNIPWLVGSMGTMIEDSIIFIQFRLYRNVPNQTDTSGARGDGIEESAVI